MVVQEKERFKKERAKKAVEIKERVQETAPLFLLIFSKLQKFVKIIIDYATIKMNSRNMFTCTLYFRFNIFFVSFSFLIYNVRAI